MEAYRMVEQLLGGVSVDGSSLTLLVDRGEEVGQVKMALCLSALHPKVLCELLDLQQIFSVDCGTGGGQRAQHVWLQKKKRFKSVLSFIKIFLHPLCHLTNVQVHFNSKDVFAAEAEEKLNPTPPVLASFRAMSCWIACPVPLAGQQVDTYITLHKAS